MSKTGTITSGRSCPITYRYSAAALALAPAHVVETLYVVGGLYGNPQALTAIAAMAAAEATPVTLCFNGDFNWFNVDDPGFLAINEDVLAHDALQGNVEAELLTPGNDAGCGCAYPDAVDAGIVERSNLIHARLKTTAQRHPQTLRRLKTLPLFRRYRLGDYHVGVVHGDAESLAGWRFDIGALEDPGNLPWLARVFAESAVNVFASTHTCLPALRRFSWHDDAKVVINNGAAGMPNFAGDRRGLITRIALARGPHPVCHGTSIGALHIEALPVAYDHAAWEAAFLANWPPGSPAHRSYYPRIEQGPPYDPLRAWPG